MCTAATLTCESCSATNQIEDPLPVPMRRGEGSHTFKRTSVGLTIAVIIPHVRRWGRQNINPKLSPFMMPEQTPASYLGAARPSFLIALSSNSAKNGPNLRFMAFSHSKSSDVMDCAGSLRSILKRHINGCSCRTRMTCSKKMQSDKALAHEESFVLGALAYLHSVDSLRALAIQAPLEGS